MKSGGQMATLERIKKKREKRSRDLSLNSFDLKEILSYYSSRLLSSIDRLSN